MRAGVGGMVVVVALIAVGVRADEPASDRVGLLVPWRVERITLGDGRALEGLVVDDTNDADDIGFVEVVRRPGRPMHLVSRRLPARSIVSIERLPDAEHAILAARIEAVRAGGRAEREAAVALQLTRRGEQGPWRYDGPRFTLESSAGQSLTRQAIVRLESLLDAFESLVPTAPAASRRLAVRLCGSQAEYTRLQGVEGIKVGNPAFYLPQRALLVAGSDVTAVLEQASLAGDDLDATAARQRALDAEVAAGLRVLAAELEAQGIPASQRAEVVARTRARWQREKSATLAAVEQARKENAAHVDRTRDAFFTSLAHEAWHAYADLRFGPRGGLPAWLDEGLAQVFETGLLEAGELRLDAPDPRRLATLAAALETERQAPLDGLLTVGERQFRVGHGTPAATSRQAYLLAWGVAYDLVLGAPALSVTSIEAAAGMGDDVARFERLVGMPIADYETAWRARMLALAKRPRPARPPVAPADARPLPASAEAAPAAPDR
ncbi:MAG: hypothetical protein WCR51_06215 [Planctomycetia bacterium]